MGQIMENTKVKKIDIFDTCETRIRDNNQGCSIIIPHVCNNIGLFGAGFASAVRNRYPIVATNFELLGNKTKLGYVQYVSVKKDDKTQHEIIVANMIAQNNIISKKNSRPLNYEALVRCMINIRNYITENSIKDKIEIHCPKFGSGLAGGNWLFIKDIIDDVWSDNSVYIYSLQK
jgi:hypothetical protein